MADKQMVKKTLLNKFGKNAWGEEIYLVEYKDAKNVLPDSEINRWVQEIDSSETFFASKNNIN